MKLLEPLDLGRRRSPNRVMFGPHETNLGQGRAISERHAAYYRARAVGGAGIVVVEEASVHPSDWPYERCPLAAEASAGWEMTAQACATSGALVLAALGHSGGQGSSAYSQRELWAPSDEPEVNSREVPKVMEPEDIEAVVEGFRLAAATAKNAGLDGVEINAGQHSLVRQFLSGLTNRRGDPYGEDRLRFGREVLTATRAGLGSDAVLGLRLSCDELAPWAGLTPELAAPVAVELASLVDYLVVVRGSIFTVAETRPTGHHATGFNLDLVGGIREAIDGLVPVLAQGSIVDPDQAEWAIQDGRCDGVEMTRAQIADPDLVAKRRADEPVRPCLLCNQRCRVRDNRNPIIGCVVEPDAGHETARPPASTGRLRNVLVVGAGPAGLEAASVAADGGASVTMVEARDRTGGLLYSIARAPGHDRFALLADHLTERATTAGVSVRLDFEADEAFLRSWDGRIVLATGSRPASTDAAIASDATLVSPLAVLDAGPDRLDELVPADVAVWDPIGNNVGVAVAELLAASGRAVTFITPDANAGTLLSLTGDLPGANVRLQQAGVRLERRQRLVTVDAASVTVANAYTAVLTSLDAPVLVDCSPRLPADDLWDQLQDEDDPGRMIRVGDAVAARTVAEAIREGRAAGLAVGGMAEHPSAPAPAVST
ncbi:MAG: mycofactocin system FadH/OYE family oxidoreductase 1 [Acidimicrobiales bacterium]